MAMLLWTMNLTAWPDDWIFMVWPFKTVNICLKRPSYYCLIHFYKRCVSALAWWVAHLRVRSGWVSVFVSHKPSLFKAKESPLYPKNPLKTIDYSLSNAHMNILIRGDNFLKSFPLCNNWRIIFLLYFRLKENMFDSVEIIKRSNDQDQPRNSSSSSLGLNTFCMGSKKAFQGFIRSVFNIHYCIFFHNKSMI